jgi:hypothetical protein
MLAKRIERFLRHAGLWTEPVGLAQARLPEADVGVMLRTRHNDWTDPSIWSNEIQNSVVVKKPALARKLPRSQLDGR